MHLPPPKRRRIDASSATAPSPKKKQQPIPSPPDIDEQLFYRRVESQNKLKSAWENIFAKYERDTSDYADEIDLRTGQIVVDKGHLRGLESKSMAGIGQDLWADWVGGDDGEGYGESENEEQVEGPISKSKAKGDGNGTGKGPGNGKGQGNRVKKPKAQKVPKVLIVGNSLFGITDCELCAELDELDGTPCTHGRDSSNSDEKENTPLIPKMQTLVTDKKHKKLAPPGRPRQPPTINLEEEDDDLSAATPIPGPPPRSGPSGLTPALNTLDINNTHLTLTESKTVADRDIPRPPPSSPIAGYISRNRPQKESQHLRSSPPIASSPPPPFSSFSSPPSKPNNPWAPAKDDPLADKIWHSHHPDGSPLRLRRGKLVFDPIYKRVVPPPRPSIPNACRDDSFSFSVVITKGGGKCLENSSTSSVAHDEQAEGYSEEQENSCPKIPVKPPADSSTSSSKGTTGIKKTLTATSQKHSKSAKTEPNVTATPRTKTKPFVEVRPKLSPRGECVSEDITSVKQEQTNSETLLRIVPKTPSKTVSKATPSKTVSKAFIETSNSTRLWSSEFNERKRKRIDSSPGSLGFDYGREPHQDSMGIGNLQLLTYVKTRVNIPSALKSGGGAEIKLEEEAQEEEKGEEERKEKVEEEEEEKEEFRGFKIETLDRDKTPVISDEIRVDELESGKESNYAAFLKENRLNDKGNRAPKTATVIAKAAPVILSNMSTKAPSKKERIRQSQHAVKAKQPSLAATRNQITRSKNTTLMGATVSQPTPEPPSFSKSHSLPLSIMTGNKENGSCGTKGYNCGKSFCWECIEAEDDHL